VGSVIVVSSTTVQPNESSTVTVYVPAKSPVLVAPVPSPLDHENVFAPTPPLADAVTAPVASPLQSTLVVLKVTIISKAVPTKVDCVAVHPLLSVTVTV